VTFKYTANPGGVSYPPAVKRMRVTTANAMQEFTADATGKTVTNMGWQTGTMEFVGAATDTLTFTSLDPAGNPCGIALDAVVVERVGVVAPPAPHETLYAWNGFDKLTQVTMTRGTVTQTRTFTYDARMRLVSETHPETGTKWYEWDDLNRLTAKLDAKNQQVRYTLDGYGRVTQIVRYPWQGPGQTEDISQRTTFTYDTGTGTNLMGRVSEIVYGDPASSPVKERFSYTVGGVVTSKTLVPGSYPALTGQWTWDNEGKMLTGKYPDWNQDTGNPNLVAGEKFVYTYDAMAMPSGMALDTGVGYVTSSLYNAAGQMTQMVRGAVLGSVTETWQYDSRGLMTRETATSWKDLSYGYGADGKVTYKKDWLGNEEYGYAYDELGRLKAAWTGSAAWGLEWDFDGFGNRYAQRVTKGSAPVASFVVDQTKNRLIGAGWTYDANGNATSTPANPSLSYDIENRLTGYLYDAANRRLREGTVIYNYYGLGGELLGQYEAKKDTYGVRKWMRRVDNSMRVWFAGRLVRAGSEAKYTDRMGSVVTQNGLRATYYPYGEEVSAVANDGREKFATYRRDATGLDYAWNRMYAATYGRFLQADPYRASASMTNPQSWNRYAYVENDPVNHFDPEGLWLAVPGNGYRSESAPMDPYGGLIGLVFGSITKNGRSPSAMEIGEFTRFQQYYLMSAPDRLQVKLAAERAVEGLGERCKAALANGALGIEPAELKSFAGSQIVFFGVGLFGSISESFISGSTSAFTLTGLLGTANASVLRDEYGTPSRYVVLSEERWISAASGFASRDTQITLVHESLHVFTKLGDVALARSLGLGEFNSSNSEVNRIAAGLSISGWLRGDCAPVQ
jgi:RHS repeat-associated protein